MNNWHSRLQKYHQIQRGGGENSHLKYFVLNGNKIETTSEKGLKILKKLVTYLDEQDKIKNN